MTRTRSRRVGLVAASVALLVTSTLLMTACGADRNRGKLPEPTISLPLRTDQVSVYFATGRSLTEERRVVDANDLYTATLAELMEAKPETPDVAIVQPEAEVRSVTFEDGLITIDWDRNILEFVAEPGEKTLALAAFLVTLGQFPEVKKVAFTVEGKDSGVIGGKDIERFWGNVTLADQPWDVARPPGYQDPAASKDETPTGKASKGETGTK